MKILPRRARLGMVAPLALAGAALAAVCSHRPPGGGHEHGNPRPTITIGPRPTISIPRPTVGPRPTVTIGPRPTVTVGPRPTVTVGPRPTVTLPPRTTTTMDMGHGGHDH
jgi:hypothetical protein